MFLAMANQSKGLLHLSFIQHVTAEELMRGQAEVTALLAELPAGFRVLTDLGRLESMDPACAKEIGKLMDLLLQRGVGSVVRVIPDPRKDIGFTILGWFHYGREVQPQTCETMVEAAKLLSL